MDDLRPSTDQKVGDSSSSGRAADQGFCTDVKCPNSTKNCTVVKCREPLAREIQALHDFPAFTPPRTHHAPTVHPQTLFRRHRASRSSAVPSFESGSGGPRGHLR